MVSVDEFEEVRGDNADVDADVMGKGEARGWAGVDVDDVIRVVRFADDRPKVDSRRNVFLNGIACSVGGRMSEREERGRAKSCLPNEGGVLIYVWSDDDI